jgi:hypothetical protein
MHELTVDRQLDKGSTQTKTKAQEFEIFSKMTLSMKTKEEVS